MRLVGWAWPLRLLLHFGPVRKSHTEGLFSSSLRRAGRNGPVVFGIEHVVRSIAITGDHTGVERGPMTMQKLRRDGNLHAFARLACACHMCKDAPLNASLAPVVHAFTHGPYQPKCARNTMPPLVKTARR
ncbi:hypothetical protein COCMIDRAFT_36066 [Bipolaris oryzae ATCC 44560]|uniref:Uncharacterized protein n=1 Tax=Bipolaris oryzae ATCC 44560 TaxID=930090 RepID=W6Z8M0_COCMI|nr:uncharacterized protein COCMIDRAFT_36066 [Bipolaris oryzae ATCC 44560]EUC46340.1 hypothetical protein COCMIDRAFT_36066 [Bipolaris oryzae ATCC 44560]